MGSRFRLPLHLALCLPRGRTEPHAGFRNRRRGDRPDRPARSPADDPDAGPVDPGDGDLVRADRHRAVAAAHGDRHARDAAQHRHHQPRAVHDAVHHAADLAGLLPGGHRAPDRGGDLGGAGTRAQRRAGPHVHA